MYLQKQNASGVLFFVYRWSGERFTCEYTTGPSDYCRFDALDTFGIRLDFLATARNKIGDFGQLFFDFRSVASDGCWGRLHIAQRSLFL